MAQPGHDGPVNPLPPAVAVLAMALAAFTLGAHGILGGPKAVGWRAAAIRDYGFSNRGCLDAAMTTPDPLDRLGAPEDPRQSRTTLYPRDEIRPIVPGGALAGRTISSGSRAGRGLAWPRRFVPFRDGGRGA